jgi:glycogen debranching enzyme
VRGVFDDPTLSVIRERTLGMGSGEDLREKLTVLNSGREEIVIELSMAFDADFADLFEVKDQQLIKKGTISRRMRGQEVELIYRREDFERRTIIRADGARLSQGSADFAVRLKPAESWSGILRVSFDSVAPREKPGTVRDQPSSKTSARGRQPLRPDGRVAEAAPVVRASWDTLKHLRPQPRDRQLRLAARPLRPGSHRGRQFRRPDCRSSWLYWAQADHQLPGAPPVPQLAAATLQVLARRQATQRDDFRDAEPGKILHELRFGELTYFKDAPHSPYYGSADSTPLFLILLDEYERWSGDTDLVVELEPQARAALEWLEHHGDLDGDGYLEYQRRNLNSGLENQCWKDSGDSIVHPDGELASLPRATCELQGYAYDARLRRLGWPRRARAATADRLNTTRPTSRPDSIPISGSPTATSLPSRWTVTNTRCRP